MVKIKALRSVIFCICFVSLEALIFSNIHNDDVKALVTRMQKRFEKQLNRYQYFLENLHGYIHGIKELLEAASCSKVEEFVSNPIYAFKLTKLLTIDLYKLQRRFKRNMGLREKALEFSSSIEEALNTYNLTIPSIQDLTGICQAIVRLQAVYEIDEENILNGNFRDYWDGFLTDDDLILLRDYYLYHKHFDVGEWLSSELYSDDSIHNLLLEYYQALKTIAQFTAPSEKFGLTNQ